MVYPVHHWLRISRLPGQQASGTPGRFMLRRTSGSTIPVSSGRLVSRLLR